MTYKFLTEWKMPSSYFGATHEGSYVFLVQNRDSDVLTRSNFICGLEALGGESDEVQVIREGHWACGWIEWIKIEGHAIDKLKIAEDILEELDGYPVVNESHFSEMEYEENYQTCKDNMKWFLKDLCKELELDQDKLSKRDIKTLEQFIEAVFMYDASYSGEAWFTVKDARERFERVTSDCDYYRTFKGVSEKMIKLLDDKFKSHE